MNKKTNWRKFSRIMFIGTVLIWALNMLYLEDMGVILLSALIFTSFLCLYGTLLFHFNRP